MLKVYIYILVENGLCLEDPLFPSLTTQGKIKQGSHLTDNNAWNVLKSTLVKVGFPSDVASKFGLHSFRIGAVQDALASGYLLEVEVQKAGWWNSSAIVNMYYVQTEDEMCKFLRVISGSIL